MQTLTANANYKNIQIHSMYALTLKGAGTSYRYFGLFYIPNPELSISELPDVGSCFWKLLKQQLS